MSDAYPPHVYLVEYPNGTLYYEGGMVNLMNMLASTMNFTSVYNSIETGTNYFLQLTMKVINACYLLIYDYSNIFNNTNNAE